MSPNIDFSFYPNPSRNEIQPKTSSEGKIQLFDASGRIQIDQFIPEGQTEISVKTLPKGVYTLQFSTKDYLSTKKIVIN